MIDVTVAATVEGPVDEVFAFAADMENKPRWHTDIVKAERLTDGAVRGGTNYRVQFRPQPMSPSEGTIEIVEFEPNRRIVSRSDMGNMKPELTHIFRGSEWCNEGHTSHSDRNKRAHEVDKSNDEDDGRRRNAEFLDNLKQLLEE